MSEKIIPDIVIGRMPLYLRSLQHMQEEGRFVTSSQELGERLGVSAAQIRKDLSHFGEFGKQGTGYQIDFLIKQILNILNLEDEWGVIIVGAGDVGSAVARYRGFSNRGFQVKMIFDSDPKKIGHEVGGFAIQDISTLIDVVRKTGLKIAMITVPAPEAQSVTDLCVQAGVKAILNYAPISLNVPPGVHVQYIDPAVHLQRMTYYLA